MIGEFNLDQIKAFALEHDDRSLGVRLAISSLLHDLAAGSSDPHTRGYLAGLADSLVRPSRLRVERPREIQ